MMNLNFIIISALIVGACVPSRKNIGTDKSSVKNMSATDASVVFHPIDPSLQVIGAELLKAKSNIDIAMYSMDVTSESPVVAALASDVMQEKLKNGSLKIRVVFEGYGSEEDNKSKSDALEKLGVDVRWFSSGRKVHHKFASIDAGTPEATLITGSANWSLGSMKNYDEAILIMRQHPGMAMAFQEEFNLLWSLSDEFGQARFPTPVSTSPIPMEAGLGVAFNTKNYKINGKKMTTIQPKVWALTHAIVEAIDSANKSIKIASTRIVLRPVYNAILRAAARGIKIDILVNQDEYDLPSYRNKKTLSDCQNEYDEKCSTEVAFPWFLDSLNYPGRENVSVHVKFFSLNTRVTLAKQMHSKYVVIDDRHVASGSFNWSTSAEYNHIENVVKIDGESYGHIVSGFSKNHAHVYGQGREQYMPYIAKIENAIKTGVKTDCAFAPMALTFQEIDYLLDSGQRAGNKAFKEACK